MSKTFVQDMMPMKKR